MERYDVLIAGAGPAGAYLAHSLSEKGLSVIVLEKKTNPGKQACSGLISTRLKTFVVIDSSFVEHMVYGATFHSKKASMTIEKKFPVAYVINRVLFDKYIISIARKAGAKILLGEALESYSVEPEGIMINNKYFARMLVGADGVGSTVRRISGLEGDITALNGVIAIYDEQSKNRTVDVFYGKSIAPGFFAWRIPRGETVEYGLATRKNHLEYFRKFLESHGRRMVKYYSHPIVFGSQKTAGERLILVGDAALQVKPFSGGGVIYGLMCAGIASAAILAAFSKNNFSKAFFEKKYDAIWKKKLIKPIENGKMMREMLNSLDDKELGTLFEYLQSHKDSITAFDMDFLD